MSSDQPILHLHQLFYVFNNWYVELIFKLFILSYNNKKYNIHCEYYS